MLLLHEKLTLYSSKSATNADYCITDMKPVWRAPLAEFECTKLKILDQCFIDLVTGGKVDL